MKRFNFAIITILIGLSIKVFPQANILVTEWEGASEQAQLIPNLLLEKGIKKIGSFSVEELVKKIADPKEILFIGISDLINGKPIGGVWQPVGSNVSRIGAECFTEEEAKRRLGSYYKKLGAKRYVNINSLSPLNKTIAPILVGLTLLHESLCSLYGFDVDDQYQITSSMAFLYTIVGKENSEGANSEYLISNKWNFLEPFKKIISAFQNIKTVETWSKFRLPATDGGVTGGHGGGDPWAPYIKFLLMARLNGLEEFCSKKINEGLVITKGVDCKVVLDKMLLLWSKIRSLSIETKKFDAIIQIGKPISSSSIFQVDKESGVLFFNREVLLKPEFHMHTDDDVLNNHKNLTNILEEVLNKLLIKWNSQYEK